MHASVLQAYPKFTENFEGFTTWMYLDRHEPDGLVTTGVGNLIDPISSAYSLPWKRPNGSLASRDEVTHAWQTIKARQDLKSQGGGIFQGLTDLRLDKEGVEMLFKNKLLQNENILRGRFQGYDFWPADAQMALLSMAWAMGANFKFPKFTAALNQLVPDFATAAAESHMQGVGIKERNEANRQLFLNAAKALKGGFDIEALYWPRIIDENFTKDEVKAGKIGLGTGLILTGLGYAAYKFFSR